MEFRMIQWGTPPYDQMIQLRYEILRKPLGLHFEQAELDLEKDDLLLGAFEGPEIEGCCVLTKKDENTLKLRQMAVPENRQGQGIGRALMHFAEETALRAGYQKILLHARKTACPFYKKLGYTVVGNEFEEVTIPHFAMEKPLA